MLVTEQDDLPAEAFLRNASAVFAPARPAPMITNVGDTTDELLECFGGFGDRTRSAADAQGREQDEHDGGDGDQPVRGDHHDREVLLGCGVGS